MWISRAVVGHSSALVPGPSRVTATALQQNLSAFFDAYPFPVKVRFLLFQGSRLLNLTPSAFSCFLLKRKCCYAPPQPPPRLPTPSPRIFSGTNLDSKTWSLDFQRRRKIALKKARDPPTHTSTQMHKQVYADFASNGPSERSAIMVNADMRSPATLKWSVPMVPQHVATFVINCSLYSGSVRTYI